MTNLSRRSKDNATDLLGLKQATSARDEDIRQSLRDLVTNLSTRLLEPNVDHGSRNTSYYGRAPGAYLLDNKPHASPPGIAKSISLPRIPSPASFAATLERDIASSPTPYSTDGAASIALLEKILREMGTKEGQERVLFLLSEAKNKSTIDGSDSTVVKKLEEILEFLKNSTESRALVTRTKNSNAVGDKTPKLELDYETLPPMPVAKSTRDDTSCGMSNPTSVTENRPYASPRAADFVGDDILKMLKRMKDSIIEGGGLSAETKALVRELRGEVLGMGREIGRKLEQAESTRGQSDSRSDAHGPGREEIAKVVEQGLAELREHMDRVMRERRRQSSSSSSSRSTVDSQEVYHAVKTALSEMPLQQQVAVQHPSTGIEREEILEAVREAWETYKPEIELQNFGLERDEILLCLKEGLQEYRPRHEAKELGGATYEEVVDAVAEGLKHFKPPVPVETEASMTREEILMTMRECLESFDFPSANVETSRESEITREDVVEAVKEGLSTQALTSREIGFNRDDILEAVKAGLEEAPTPMAGVGEQVLERMQDLIEEMKDEFKQYSSANGKDTEQVLDAMKDGMEVLRAGIETYVDRAADVTGKDEIVETVRDGLEHLRIDLEGAIVNASRNSEKEEVIENIRDGLEHLRIDLEGSIANTSRSSEKEEIIETVRDGLEHLRVDLKNSIANAPRSSETTNSGELLDAMEKEFEHLRQTIATSMVRNGGSTAEKEELLDAIRDGFDGMKANVLRPGATESDARTVVVIRDEFEHLRETLATTMVRSGPSIDREDIVETIREGLEGIRSDMEKSNDKPESILSNTGELLDAFNEGLDGLRVDIEKIINKPLDMTLNYEILDTLKDGLSSVRADIDRLHAARAEQEELTSKQGGEVVIADGDSIRRNDIENLEVMITQLRIKVEALDSMPPPPPAPPAEPTPVHVEGMVMKEDLGGLEAMLKEVQASIASLSERERYQDENTATKNDTDAIETLLRNTKAKLDDLIFPEPEGMVKIEHVDSIEAGIKGTLDAVDAVAARVESEIASKDDILILESLLKEVHTGLGEVSGKAGTDEVSDKVTKSDFETLETLCMEVKTHLEELVLPDTETTPTKAEIESLNVVIKEFKETMEAEADLTAQAFEARKIEHGGIADKIEDVKGFLDDIRQELKSNIHENGQGIEGLAKTLETVNDMIVASDATPTIKELMEIVNREFERFHGNHEGYKLDAEQNNASLLEQHDEHRKSIINDLSSKIDARFDEIMTKHDDAQLAADAKTDALQDRETQQAEAVESTRMVAEDLKTLVDSLSKSVTESCDRMGEDSKTVFHRVDDIGTKLDDSVTILIADGKSNHQLTRAEVSRTLIAVEGVQTHAMEYHHKILAAISDVLHTVGQHFERAQRSSEEIKTSVNAIPSAIPVPAITAPPLLPSPEREIPVVEKYDDSNVHAKLDQLVQNTTEAAKTAAQFELLEQIKSQVAASAADFNAFVVSQQNTIAESQQLRAREAEEVAIALEKRVAQKEIVEAEIARLSDERLVLITSVETLQNDHKVLTGQKARLQADLSSLETALHIRREEMQLMEARAEGLEKRILEGVLDHSRSLLITSRPQSSLQSMNLKRVPSTAPYNTNATRTSSAATSIPTTLGSRISTGVGMALKRRQPARNTAGGAVNNAKGDRRILSLSTIGANRGLLPERAMVLANPSLISAGAGKPSSAFGGGGLKRSHSVKSNFPVRKTSWGGTRQGGMYADELDEDDKENSVLNEEDEDGSEEGTERRTSYGTDTGTERRTSYTGTYTGTGSYGTDSVMDGDDDRRTSYAASTVGTVGMKGAEHEEAESESVSEGHGRDDEGPKEIEPGDRDLGLHEGSILAANVNTGNAGEVVVFGLPSDSGIGSDLPTAAIDGRSDYFKPS